MKQRIVTIVLLVMFAASYGLQLCCYVPGASCCATRSHEKVKACCSRHAKLPDGSPPTRACNCSVKHATVEKIAVSDHLLPALFVCAQDMLTCNVATPSLTRLPEIFAPPGDNLSITLSNLRI